MNDSPIRIGFIGAGLFARDVHVPSLLSLEDTYQIVAVQSRTRDSAEKLAEIVPYAVDITTDMDALLARDDIDVVALLLPIPLLPDAVEKALKSGKHVVSEKPIAPDVATGKRLLALPRADGQQWMVAENWRYEAMYQQAGEIVDSGVLGAPIVFNWAIHIAVNPDNKYYHTAWRRSGDFPGGFLLDGGVHHIAAIRQILGEVDSVTAMVTQAKDDLPPADTLVATLRMKSGALGTYTVTYAATGQMPDMLDIVCAKGSMRVNREVLKAVHGEEQIMPVPQKPDGVSEEYRALALTLNGGSAHINTPEQALQDVAVLEAMLESARTGAMVTIEQVV